MDILGSAIFLLIMALPMILIGLLIRLSSRGGVIFQQERAGKDGRAFTLYKFRSMKCKGEESSLFHEEEMVTGIGKFLRKWRLDEIPQALNVLLGTMSLVGPRPTLLYQIERYNEEQRRRLTVKPGITGWAQINGDKAITWPERIELDLWYVDNWSIWLDVVIILRTPVALSKISRINVESAPPKDDISREEKG